VRKLKKVKELVNNSRKSLKPLLRDDGETRLVETLRHLLESRIFESELRAKVEFPDLFRPSPFRDAQRQVSEIDAARSTAEALDEIVSQDGEELGVEDIENNEPEEAEEQEELMVEDDTAEPLAGTFLNLQVIVRC
jgi:hypothetical protein